MNDYIRLKKGKDKPIRNHHHWIFSGAVEEPCDRASGDIVAVLSSGGEQLGHAYVNARSSIYGRMISFGGEDPRDAVRRNVLSAIELRTALIKEGTNAYRIVNGEGDHLPGLIVDKYDDVYIMQIGTLGMEKLKEFVCSLLSERSRPRSIIEHSLIPSRKDEGLKPYHGVLCGDNVADVYINENGLKFHVDLTHGQKTGFFLDQRHMRELVRTLSAGRRCLNLFSYTGAFSVYALAGGALHAVSIDSAETAIDMAQENSRLNGYTDEQHKGFCNDVFDFIRSNPIDQDLVIIDPPAFAKGRKDIVKACRGYKDINRIVIEKVPPRSLVVSCSCSYYIDATLFQTVIFQAACEAQRRVKIVQRHHLAYDHPINVYHPESDYLKSLVLYVE
ncbi:MAG: class I SAM-dependent rRNA methyltransferase [Candidatus Omnitrophica bacterium]|nr:class I SAM-dependent rRNA methyltransferase [Candidatus Omnitrophota bacterium]